MAKNKTVKTEASVKETVAQATPEAVQAEAVPAEPVKVEAVAEKTGAPVAEAPVSEQAAEEAKAAVTETTGQVASFVKERLEQAQRHFGQLETEAQKALRTLVSRGRESGREVLQRLNVNELRWRENPAVRRLEKQATWVGGEVRQRLGGLRSRMVEVVGGVASQSRVETINRELDRLTRKLDALVSPRKPEQPRETPKA